MTRGVLIEVEGYILWPRESIKASFFHQDNSALKASFETNVDITKFNETHLSLDITPGLASGNYILTVS